MPVRSRRSDGRFHCKECGISPGMNDYLLAKSGTFDKDAQLFEATTKKSSTRVGTTPRSKYVLLGVQPFERRWSSRKPLMCCADGCPSPCRSSTWYLLPNLIPCASACVPREADGSAKVFCAACASDSELNWKPLLCCRECAEQAYGGKTLWCENVSKVEFEKMGTNRRSRSAYIFSTLPLSNNKKLLVRFCRFETFPEPKLKKIKSEKMSKIVPMPAENFSPVNSLEVSSPVFYIF